MIMRCFKDIYNKPYNCHHIASINHKKQIVPFQHGNLFLSGTGALYKNIIQTYSISSILTVLNKQSYQYNSIERKIKQFNLHQHHKWIDMNDSQLEHVYPYLQDAIQFIRKKLQTRNVLVHCQQGISRSASFVIAFLMKEFGMTLEQAEEHTINMRDIVCPNQTFRRDLQKYEKQLIQKGFIKIQQEK